MKKKIIMMIVAASIACQPLLAFAKAAPDGMTDATKTEAAQNGAWEAWCNRWEQIKTDWTEVSMSPGSNETEMNFAWYSKNGEESSFIYGNKEDLSDGQKVEAQVSKAQEGYNSNKLTLKNLKPGTTYYYQVSGKEIHSFTTSKDSKSFSFIFVGDPQIGSSNPEKAKLEGTQLSQNFIKAQSEAIRNDAFNWNDTLNKAYEKTGNSAAFVLSSGDQIQTTAKKTGDKTISEIEYAGYLSPKLMRSVPFATTVGNHDADNENYTYHFNTTNSSDLGTNKIAGGDYYYTYGDALFMVLNTQNTNIEEHRQFIESTVKANKDSKWRIVSFHQDIYGSAEHSNEPEIVNLRYSLIPILEDNDVDIVLNGHDHAYSRTKMLKGATSKMEYSDDEFDEQLDKDMDAGENPENRFVAPQNIKDDTQDEGEKKYLEYLHSIMDDDAVLELTGNQDVAVNSDGIMYLTAGSSSGSKYYDLVPRQQSYIANRWQQDVPTYSVIDVSETTLTLNTYRTDTQEAIDSQFMLVKSADHGQLAELIKQAEAINPDEYTTESYETMAKALEGARRVNLDPAADTDTITNAYTALKTTMDKLEKKNTGDITAPEVNDPTDNNTTDNGQTDNTETNVEGLNQKPEVPKTGDNNSMIFVIVGMASVICLGGIGLYRRKCK